MLDSDLKWNAHIDYIGQKANKTAFVMDRLNWLPELTYAQKIWFNKLKFKYQDTKLTRIQRKIILAITRAYWATTNYRLHRFLGILDINEEMNIELEERSREEKEERYAQLLADEGRTYNEIKNTSSKESLWFMAGRGSR